MKYRVRRASPWFVVSLVFLLLSCVFSVSGFSKGDVDSGVDTGPSIDWQNPDEGVNWSSSDDNSSSVDQDSSWNWGSSDSSDDSGSWDSGSDDSGSWDSGWDDSGSWDSGSDDSGSWDSGWDDSGSW